MDNIHEGKRILVVDDEEICRQLLRHRLRQEGCEVIEAEEAANALRILRSEPIDLVLIDVMMPGMSGIELLKLIRVDFSTIDLPVIMVSALDDGVRIAQAIDLGASDYLIKPFDYRVAKARIREQLQRKQQIDAMRACPSTELQLSELKKRFMAMVSHEFRTPMTMILSSAELMDAQMEEAVQIQCSVYINRIATAVERMNELLDDLLVVGAGENGSLNVEARQIDLLSLCQRVVNDMQIADQETSPVFVQSCGAPGPVLLDPKLVTLVVQNLISNSVKYSPDGKPVELTIRFEENRVSLTVRDQGIGIPHGELNQVLEMFYRAGNVNRFPGNGVGLAMVKSCAEAHHGGVRIDSTVGKGTEVTVVFPQEFSFQPHAQAESGFAGTAARPA